MNEITGAAVVDSGIGIALAKDIEACEKERGVPAGVQHLAS